MDGKWCLLTGICALLFLITGMISPGWFRIAVGEISLDMGLWFFCFHGSCVAYATALDVGTSSEANGMYARKLIFVSDL